MKRLLSVLLFVCLAFSSLWAQQKVTGIVKDQQGEPLPGVTVLVKNTTTGSITDVEGNFQVQLEDGKDILVFSFVGMQTQEISTQGKSNLKVVLKEESLGMDEVVVVGYGVQKKVNLTGSVSAVDFEELSTRPVSNSINAIQGTSSGVQITTPGGQPGSDQGTIRIRGVGTLSNANPLVLIDGVQSTLGDLGALSPNEIENVSVLKDAASSAIYGSRAANGVILVTTKSGKNGKGKIQYNYYYGLQKATVLPDLLDSWDYATLLNESYVNGGKAPLFTEEMIELMRNNTQPDYFTNTDWADEVFRVSPVQSHSLSFSGGSDAVNYFVNFGYFDQEGTMRGTSMDRFNVRSKLDFQAKEWLKIGINLSGNKKVTEEPNNGISGDNSIMRSLAFASPISPVKYSNGDYSTYIPVEGYAYIKNPLLEIHKSDFKKNTFRINTQAYAEATLSKDLTFKTVMSYNRRDYNSKKFSPEWTNYDTEGNITTSSPYASLSTQHTIDENYLAEAYLNFKKRIKENHNIAALAGYSFQNSYSLTNKGSVRDFPTNEVRVPDAGAIDDNVSGGESSWALQSLFGRFNYNYKEKYLLEANLRYDGSSRFAPGNRWGLFPSFSAAWRLSQETFLQDVAWLTNLKLRASWGQLGNQEIGKYPYSQTFNVGNDYLLGIPGQELVNGGSAITTTANKNITWETTETTDIGVDVNLWSKLDITMDYFIRDTYDILLKLPIPWTLGNVGAPYKNAGQVRNQGWEFAAQYSNRVGAFSYNLGFNVTHVTNEIVDLKGEKFYPSNRIHQEGYALGSWFGYEVEGIFQTPEEIAEANNLTENGTFYQHKNTVPGDLKYKDQDGNGFIDDKDRVVLGNSFPEWVYGFNGGFSAKGFDCSFLFQGQANVQIYSASTGNHTGDGDRMNWTSDWMDRWTPENPSTTHPRLASGWKENSKVSDYWLQDASYLRLKNLEIGYTLPKRMLQSIGAEKVRLYMGCQNIWTWTNVENWDVERSGGQTRNEAYPQNKVYQMGVNVTF